jgi:quercetin 2,3-dioxygenase
MIKKLLFSEMGKSDLGWLQATFHFSFAEYYNPDNMNFGPLRVLNDDNIQPHGGFGTHPHKNMEIVTYVISGTLGHKDNMGNEETVTRGQVQYLSAGTGITHSEFNQGDEPIRLLQTWIVPNKQGHTPSYGDYKFPWDDRLGKWLHMVSNKQGSAPVKINQDVNYYVSFLRKDEESSFEISKKRQAYLVQIEGSSRINNLTLNQGDGLQSIATDLNINPKTDSHILVIEMKGKE